MNPKKTKKLVRNGAPNEWDQWPYGTEIFVVDRSSCDEDGENCSIEAIYMQTSRDSSNPKWEIK